MRGSQEQGGWSCRVISIQILQLKMSFNLNLGQSSVRTFEGEFLLSTRRMESCTLNSIAQALMGLLARMSKRIRVLPTP